AERYPHAAEMLRLYQALTVVSENLPSPVYGGGQGGGIAALAAEHALPGVIEATVEFGPRALRDGVVSIFCSANLVDLVQRWLDGQPLTPVETYLARASASPLLEALNSPHPALPQRGREMMPPPQGGR